MAHLERKCDPRSVTPRLRIAGTDTKVRAMKLTQQDEDTLEFALREAQRLGADAAEAAVSTSESLSADVRMQALESVEREESRSLAVRLLFGRRQAGASTSNLSRATVKELIERVTSAAKLAPEDPFAGLLDSEWLARSGDHELQLCDPSRPSAGELEAAAREAEAAGLAVPGVTNSGGSGASWSVGAFRYRNSLGFDGGSSGSSFSLGLSMLAERDGLKERDYESNSSRWREDLWSPEAVGRIAGERATARLGARKLTSCRAPIIFEARIAGRLLGPLFGAISGPAVARGVSFLRDQLGASVFPKGFNILNDPLRQRGAASRSFDGEGMATRPRKLIDDGVLTGWLLNAASARQLGLSPSGDASFGHGGAPGVTSSNLVVSAGSHPLEQLMADAGAGLLVCETFSPSLNPNSGDFSVGVAGFWFENGARAFPVSEVTIAGNLREMYQRVLPGADVEHRGALEAPSLLVDDVTIAGR